MRFRPLLCAHVSMLVGLAIGCAGSVTAKSQELGESKPAAPRNVAALVTDPIRNDRVPGTADLPPDDATSQAASSSINPLWAFPIASLAPTRNRPIFSPSRRPLAAVSQMPAQSALPIVNEPVQSTLTLVGAVAGEIEGIAILRDEMTKDIIRLKTGESYSGWTLRLVKGREATLEKSLETEILSIQLPPAPNSSLFSGVR
jgi:hypothetical protein